MTANLRMPGIEEHVLERWLLDEILARVAAARSAPERQLAVEAAWGPTTGGGDGGVGRTGGAAGAGGGAAL